MFRLCLLLAALLTTAWGQTTGTATIAGAVTDPSGAVVAGAKVTVVNVNTSFVYNSVTTAEGTYYIPNLNPGTYRLTIEAAGFRSHVRDGVLLRTEERPRIDVQLEVGTVSESVQVTGAPPLLETETSASGQVLDGATIVKIPVLQKAFYRIYLYMPGMNVINGQHAVGQRQRSLGYTLDGVNAKEPVGGNPNSLDTVITSTLDMIQEFKLWTTGLPAEFGHSSGGQLSGVFRSGTNDFHGALEDRYLTGRLVHRQFFDQLKRCQNVLNICNPFGYHEMGGIAGGPVYIPKLYNGKDKTFFFWGLQRHHEKVSETNILPVPSPAMYAGDFSFEGRGFPIHDPRSTVQEPGGRWVRTPFPNNRIPLSQFDPVARNLLGRNPWNAQNTTGVLTPSGPTQNLVIPTKGRFYFTRFDQKIDHQFSPSHKIFGRYSHMRHRNVGRFSPQILWELADPQFTIPIDQGNAVISDTYTINPTTINEARLGFNRRRRNREPVTQGQDWARQLGIPNVGAETFPQFEPRYYALGPGGRDQQVAEDFSFQNNFTKIVGKHTLKLGYEIIRTRYNHLPAALPSGQYNMGATDFPFTPNTGNAFASLLLGSVSSAVFTANTATWLPRWWSHGWYVQTDYKPIRTLTLNLGLRWSYESPFSTKYGQQAQFDPNGTDPITGRRGAILHTPGALAKRDLNNFQPRLGLAWQFRPKWVYRGNFSFVTGDLLSNIGQNFEEYLATANVQQLPGDPRPAFFLSQGPPARSFNVAADGSTPFLGANFSARNVSWFDPNMRMPYVMNWSSGVQYEFARTWVTELQYQGSAGVGLLNNWNINVLPLNIASDFATLDRLRTQYQNFRPYTQFGAINHYSNYGHNTYHGLTLRVEKRFSAGLTVNSFYTKSKTLDEADEGGAGGITFYNRSLEKGRANYDVQNRWVSTFTYELPVGRGKRFMNTGGWKNAVLGGWEMVFVQTFQTGPPFTMGFAGARNVYLPNMALRPNQVLPNDQAKLQHVDIGHNRFPFTAQNRYLKLDAFRYPDSFTPGTVGRNTLEAPGIVWAQASISKEWPILERLKFQLRFDVNNLYKYHNFNPPNAAFNTTDPSVFGTFNGTRGSFSDIGTGRWHGIMVFRVEW